jgi:hypothetical protein
METPQRRDAVEEPVHPVLHEVRQKHDGDELHDEGQRGHPGAEGRPRGDGEQRLSGQEAQPGEHLHHHAADEVVEEVLAPLVAEDALLGPVRKNRLQRDEEEAGEEQSQHEEVEPEV